MLNPKDLIALIQAGQLQITVIEPPKPKAEPEKKRKTEKTELERIIDIVDDSQQPREFRDKALEAFAIAEAAKTGKKPEQIKLEVVSAVQERDKQRMAATKAPKAEQKLTAEQQRQLEDQKRAAEKQLQHRKDAGPLTVEDLQSLDNRDHFHKTQLVQWLKQMGMLEKIECIYFCDNSKEIVIRMKEHAATDELTVKLMALQFSELGRSGFSTDELRKVVLPSVFFSGLLGFKYIPFEKDCISNDGETIDYNSREIRNFKKAEIKIPYIINHLAPRVLYYILNRLEKYGFNPELFDDMDKLPTLDELMATLPEAPKGAEALFKKYADLDILRLQPSQVALGFTRILTDSFEATLKGLAKLPCKDGEFQKRMLDSLRLLSPAVGVDSAILYRLLTKFYGDNPSLRLGHPVALDKQLLVPSEIDVPAPEIAGKKRRTLFILDTSGSMNEVGKMDGAKKATFSVLEQLAQNPDEEVAAFGYTSTTSTIFPTTKLNGNNLAELRGKIANVRAGGSTYILPVLEEMEKYLPSEKEAELIEMSVLLLSDGDFNDAHADEIRARLQKLKNKNVTFNCIGLELAAGGQPEKDLNAFVEFSQQNKLGGQLKFTPVAKVDEVMSLLVLNEGGGGRGGIQSMFVRYSDGKGSDLGTVRISPCALNKPTFSHLPLSVGASNYAPLAKALGVNALPFTVEIVYESGAKAIIQGEIPCDMLSKPQALVGFNRDHFIKKEFLQQRLLGKTSEVDRIEAMMQAYEEAKGFESKLLMEEVLLKLQPFLQSYRAQNIDCSFPSKKAKLAKLRELYDAEFGFRHYLLVEMLEKEIAVLETDATLAIEVNLFAEAHVKDYTEFLTKPLGQQLAAYMVVHIKLLKDQIKLSDKVDKKAVIDQVAGMVDKIWVDGTLCLDNKLNTRAEFDALPVLKRYEAFENVRKKAENGKKVVCLESIDKQMEAIWCEVSLLRLVNSQRAQAKTPTPELASLADFNKATHAREKLEALERVLETAAKMDKKSYIETLQTQINNVWLEGNLYRAAGENINSMAQFYALGIVKQLRVYQAVLKTAQDNQGRSPVMPQIIRQINVYIDGVWQDASLCAEMGCENMIEFARASALQQLQAMKIVLENAKREKRDLIANVLSKRIDDLEVMLTVEQFGDKPYAECLKFKLQDKVRIFEQALEHATKLQRESQVKILTERLNNIKRFQDKKVLMEAFRKFICDASGQDTIQNFNVELDYAIRQQKLQEYLSNALAGGQTEIADEIEARLKVEDHFFQKELKAYIEAFDAMEKVNAENAQKTGKPVANPWANSVNRAVPRPRYMKRTRAADRVVAPQDKDPSSTSNTNAAAGTSLWTPPALPTAPVPQQPTGPQIEGLPDVQNGDAMQERFGKFVLHAQLAILKVIRGNLQAKAQKGEFSAELLEAMMAYLDEREFAYEALAKDEAGMKLVQELMAQAPGRLAPAAEPKETNDPAAVEGAVAQAPAGNGPEGQPNAPAAAPVVAPVADPAPVLLSGGPRQRMVKRKPKPVAAAPADAAPAGPAPVAPFDAPPLEPADVDAAPTDSDNETAEIAKRMQRQ